MGLSSISKRGANYTHNGMSCEALYVTVTGLQKNNLVHYTSQQNTEIHHVQYGRNVMTRDSKRSFYIISRTCAFIKHFVLPKHKRQINKTSVCRCMTIGRSSTKTVSR